MSQISTLITGAAVVTTVSGQAQCDEYIILGDIDTTNPLQGIAVEVDGTPFINIQNSAPLVGAFAKWMSRLCAAVVGICFKVSTGAIRRNTTYRFTNNGATTPAIKVWSDSQFGVPFVATTKQINVSSYEDFEKFSAIILTLPANVSSVEIVWADGHKSTQTVEEVDAEFALKYDAEADGRLNACTVIDNTDQSIISVRIFAGATAVTALIIKVPDAAFKVLMAARGK